VKQDLQSRLTLPKPIPSLPPLTTTSVETQCDLPTNLPVPNEAQAPEASPPVSSRAQTASTGSVHDVSDEERLQNLPPQEDDEARGSSASSDAPESSILRLSNEEDILNIHDEDLEEEIAELERENDPVSSQQLQEEEAQVQAALQRPGSPDDVHEVAAATVAQPHPCPVPLVPLRVPFDLALDWKMMIARG